MIEPLLLCLALFSPGDIGRQSSIPPSELKSIGGPNNSVLLSRVTGADNGTNSVAFNQRPLDSYPVNPSSYNQRTLAAGSVDADTALAELAQLRAQAAAAPEAIRSAIADQISRIINALLIQDVPPEAISAVLTNIGNNHFQSFRITSNSQGSAINADEDVDIFKIGGIAETTYFSSSPKIAISPDGKYIAAFSGKLLVIFDNTGTQIGEYTSNVFDDTESIGLVTFIPRTNKILVRFTLVEQRVWGVVIDLAGTRSGSTFPLDNM